MRRLDSLSLHTRVHMQSSALLREGVAVGRWSWDLVGALIACVALGPGIPVEIDRQG
jgi:hypothetical protein